MTQEYFVYSKENQRSIAEKDATYGMLHSLQKRPKKKLKLTEVLMSIENCDGDFECHSWNEIEKQIKQSSVNQFDDIWLRKDTDYPCLAILIHGTYACVHYFLTGQGDVWQSVGYGDKDVAFALSIGDRSDMPANCVISLDKAIECAKQFYDILDKPRCIEWRKL